MQYKAKKSLGQNFLHSVGALNKIVKASNLTPNDLVMEIGPGKGALTKKLLEKGAKVIAIEKDVLLAGHLKQIFSEQISKKQINIVEGDALNTDLLKLSVGGQSISDCNFKLVANIPYYITGEILRLFIGGNIKPKSATLLVQKEVADRILERDGKGSILSMSIRCYGGVKYVAKVPKASFNPVPKVDSAIIHINNISRDFFDGFSEELFFNVLKYGFAHKRKKLMNNLSEIISTEKIRPIFESIGLKDTVRAEELKLKDWQNLVQDISKE